MLASYIREHFGLSDSGKRKAAKDNQNIQSLQGNSRDNKTID